VPLDDLAADRQSEPRAFRFRRESIADLMELFEDRINLIGRDSDAAVRNLDDRRAVVMEGVMPKVVPAKDVAESALWVHDESNVNAAKILADLWVPEFPVPIGVFSSIEAPVYEDTLLAQEQRAISERGPGDIAKLLTSGDTWKISSEGG